MFFFFLIAIIVGIPVVYRVVPLGDIVVVRFVRINVSFRVFTCCYSSWRSSCCRFCHCYLFLLVLLLSLCCSCYYMCCSCGCVVVDVVVVIVGGGGGGGVAVVRWRW